jgi:molybdopterin-binding protein
VLVVLRPEDITITRPDDASPPTSARNRLEGSITRIVPGENQARISIDCGFPLLALITKQSLEDLELRVGDRVQATFKAHAVHLIRKRHRIA